MMFEIDNQKLVWYAAIIFYGIVASIVWYKYNRIKEKYNLSDT